MLNNLTIITIFTFFNWNCMLDKPRTQELYPYYVIKNHLESPYDIAKFEMYNLNSNEKCSCAAFAYGEKNNDTSRILSLNVLSDDIQIEGDTATFYFSFCDSENKRMPYVTDIYSGCMQCVGIKMVKNEVYMAFYAEDGYQIFNKKEMDFRDSVFIESLKSVDPGGVNKWLYDYINIPH